jgi:serine/threonine-protein kinase
LLISKELNPAFLLPGTQIGFYKVVKLVGKGGFAAVYQVARAGKVFALKLGTFNLDKLTEEERTSHLVRAKREAAALMQLRHPNVVQVHAFDHWPDIDIGHPYLVMDFVDGLQLRKWARAHQPSARQVAQVFHKIALAVNEIHRRQIYHRDLKSENVLIRKMDGEPVLVDFGLCRPRSTQTVTVATEIIGSRSTFAPEYCEHAFAPSDEDKTLFVHQPTTELHAVGFMLYEVLTGRAPFDLSADKQIDLIAEVESKIPPRPTQINAAVPKALADIAMKLLAKQPQNRFQSGQELALALADALKRPDPNWDTPLKAPASLLPDVPTPDSSAPVADKIEEEPVKSPRPLSDARVERVSREAQSQAQEDANEAAEQSPNAAQTQQLPPQSTPLFAPPLPEQAFVPPEEAAAEEQRSTAKSSLASSIRQLRIADTRPRPGGKLGVALAGVGILLAAVLATAVVVARRAKEAHRPESLLVKLQTQSPPAEPEGHESTAAPAAVLEATLTPVSGLAGNDAHHAGLAGTKQKSVRGGGMRKTAGKTSDEEHIDALYASHYGRPNIPEKADVHQARLPEPGWIQRGRRADSLSKKRGTSAPKKLGVPFGTHLRVRLATELDSRTIGDGLVEATLTRPFLTTGEPILPSKTMLYGLAHTSGGRFTVQFFRLRLPDNAELPFSGLALDVEDNKPGLVASARIAAPPPGKESLVSKVAKNTGGTLLGKLAGDDAADVARGAGQTALSHSEQTGSYGTSDVLLLEAGRDFEVFVKEAF